MALTTTVLQRNVSGNQKVNTIAVTFDASYPTGGEAVVPSDFGLLRLDAIVSANASPYGSSAYIVNYASPYLQVISLAEGVEAGDTTDLLGMVVNVIAFGQ